MKSFNQSDAISKKIKKIYYDSIKSLLKHKFNNKGFIILGLNSLHSFANFFKPFSLSFQTLTFMVTSLFW